MSRARDFILLAEDDVDDQELIKMAFERATSDHSFEIANNGQEALDILQHHDTLPCVIVLDFNMPILNGIQTLKKLNTASKYYKVPKVILTTSDSEENKKMCYLNGAVDYLVKPDSMQELVKTVRKILSYCQ
ncbi:MAG: response regulator [Chryseolinea sp.]